MRHTLRGRMFFVGGLLGATLLLTGCPGIPDPGKVVAQPLPEPAATVVTNACNTLATAVQPYGVNTLALTFTCGAAVQGTESQLLRTFLASPTLGCIALAGPITALLPPVAAACTDFATAIQPYSSLLGGALDPVLT